MLSDFPESSCFPQLLWTKTDYFCMISQNLTIFQRYLNSDLQETAKKINWYLVSTYGFKKNHKISNSDRRKKLTFSKFLYPYGRMLPSGTIKPFNNGELFRSNEHTFGISTIIELQVRGKKIVYSLASRSRSQRVKRIIKRYRIIRSRTIHDQKKFFYSDFLK